MGGCSWLLVVDVGGWWWHLLPFIGGGGVPSSLFMVGAGAKDQLNWFLLGLEILESVEDCRLDRCYSLCQS